MQRLGVIESSGAFDRQKKFKRQHGHELNRNIYKIHEKTGLDGHTLNQIIRQLGPCDTKNHTIRDEIVRRLEPRHNDMEG